MVETMTIGDFSRATRLSAKTLRFYHHEGLLAPARVDPVNGYRLYSVEQISQAQVIRHFRALEMPLGLIRKVLAAPSTAERNDLVAAHLTLMEAQLERTRSAVASLRSLLAQSGGPFVVMHRSVPATPAVVIRDTIDLVELGRWYTTATGELEQLLLAGAVRPVGPRGGIWDTELFLNERGAAALFIPVSDVTDGSAPIGRAHLELLPAVNLAVATHYGTDETIHEIYAALGRYVTQHELSIDGPIREAYISGPTGEDGIATTEIGWPICAPIAGEGAVSTIGR